jgi:hypothetical protein
MSRSDAPLAYEAPRSILLSGKLASNGLCITGTGASNCYEDGNSAADNCSTGASASGCQYDGSGAATYCTSEGSGFD